MGTTRIVVFPWGWILLHRNSRHDCDKHFDEKLWSFFCRYQTFTIVQYLQISKPISTVFKKSIIIFAVANSNGAPPKEYRDSHVCAIFHFSDSDGGIFHNVAFGHYQQSPPGEECFIFLRIGWNGQLGSLKQHWWNVSEV